MKKILLLASFSILAIMIAFACFIMTREDNLTGMEKNYNRNGAGMEAIVRSMPDLVPEGKNVSFSFRKGEESVNFVSGSTEELAVNSKIDAKDFYSREQLERLKKKLKDVDCYGIKTCLPDYCELFYKLYGLGGIYSYIVYFNALTPEQKDKFLSDTRFIPYNDNVVFRYEDMDERGFDPEEREKYLKSAND